MGPKFILIVVYCVFLAFPVCAGPTLATPDFFSHSLPTIEKGDWVFRRGHGLDSTLIRTLSQGQFSHVGIVIETHPTIIILHATTDDDPAHLNQVIVSDIAQFFRQDQAKKIAIVRPTFLTPSQKQNMVDLVKKEIGAPFILDKKKSHNRYCTTLIAHAVKYLYPDFNPHWQTIDVPFFQGQYLFPDALFHYPLVERIYLSDGVN